MPDVQSFVVSITSTAPQEADSFRLFGGVDSVIGVIANYAQVLTFVGIIPAGATILSLLADTFFPGGPSDRQILDTISQKLDTLIRFDHGLLQHFDMLDIDPIIGAADDRLETLLRVGPDSPDVDRAATIQDSLNAVNFLGNRDYWTRPFFDEVTYGGNPATLPAELPHIAWYENSANQSLKPPEDATGFVFDPQLSFPAFMRAIEVRGCVLPIFHPADFEKVFASEFSDTADTLEGHYNEMLSGLLMAPVPAPEQIIQFVDQGPDFPDLVVKVWSGTYGAIDIYRASALLEFYPESTFPAGWDSLGLNPHPTQPVPQVILDLYPALKAQLTLGGLARFKALYIVGGLHNAWGVLQNLKQVAGRSDFEKIDVRACWSLREVDNALGDVFVDPSGPPGLQGVTARGTIGRLLKLANAPLGTRLSFRDAVAQATP